MNAATAVGGNEQRASAMTETSGSANSTAISIREVIAGDDSAIAAFGDLQRQVYFDPDMLIPEHAIRAMVGGTTGTRRNFLVVAENSDGALLGGTFFHLLVPPGMGFSSFMGVRPSARGQGIARMLHAARFAILDRAMRDAMPDAGPVPGVFIDVVAPERLSAEEMADERRAGFDPQSRRRVFAHLGFQRVEIAYEQPVGGPNGGPVTTMDLLFCPHDASLSEVPTAWVTETMRAYWTPWLGLVRAGQAVAALEARANGRETLRLLPAV